MMLFQIQHALNIAYEFVAVEYLVLGSKMEFMVLS